MSTAQAHLDIARERFLELMAAKPGADVDTVAIVAISQADAFARMYQKYAVIAQAAQAGKDAALRVKGCRACHGSGGKAGDPCKVCGGTGKVPT